MLYLSIISNAKSRKFLRKIKTAFKEIALQTYKLTIISLKEGVWTKNLEATLLFEYFSKAFHTQRKDGANITCKWSVQRLTAYLTNHSSKMNKTWDTAREARTNLWAMFSHGFSNMNVPVLAGQQRPTSAVGTRFSQDDLPGVMDNRDGWRVRELHAVSATWWVIIYTHTHTNNFRKI